MAAHGRRSNTDTVTLPAKHQACRAEAVVRAIKIDCPDVVPVLHFVIQSASLGWDASVGDHHVETAKVLDDLVHRLLHGLILAHIDLVCPDGDTKLLGNGSTQFLSLG